MHEQGLLGRHQHGHCSTCLMMAIAAMVSSVEMDNQPLTHAGSAF